MSEFANVTVIKKASIYFNGQVSSRTIKFADGSIKTLGIMLPGEYLFNTADAELMEILSGNLSYKITGSDTWNNIQSGETFNVPANSSFNIKVSEITDYCCTYIKQV